MNRVTTQLLATFLVWLMCHTLVAQTRTQPQTALPTPAPIEEKVRDADADRFIAVLVQFVNLAFQQKVEGPLVRTPQVNEAIENVERVIRSITDPVTKKVYGEMWKEQFARISASPLQEKNWASSHTPAPGSQSQSQVTAPISPPALSQAKPQTNSAAMPTGSTNGGGVTSSGRKYDYKKVEAGKITYFHVLRTREEIDAYIERQATANPGDDHWNRLKNLPWHVMQKQWREDPVTSSPITSMPPTQKQLGELATAIMDRLNLNSSAKEEFIAKIGSGECVGRNVLDPRRFVLMVNGTGTNEKLEAPAHLAAHTKSCEFFLESEPVVINLVFICGNFGYVFVDVWWETTPGTPGINEPPQPAEATCELMVGGVTMDPNVPLVIKPGETAILTGRAKGDITNLQLRSQWFVNDQLQVTNPTFGGSEDFPFGPKVTQFKTGSYNGQFTLTDQFGRRSTCPFKGEVKPIAPPEDKKPVCPECLNKNSYFKLAGDHPLILKASTFFGSAQIKPGTLKITVNGDTIGETNGETEARVHASNFPSSGRRLATIEAEDVNGCILRCEFEVDVAVPVTKGPPKKCGRGCKALIVVGILGGVGGACAAGLCGGSADQKPNTTTTHR